MCKAKPYPRCSFHARATLQAAQNSGDLTRIKAARKVFFTTPAGIKHLREAGRETLANLYSERRNRLNAIADKLMSSQTPKIRFGVDIDNTFGDFTGEFKKNIIKQMGYTPEQADKLLPEATDYSFVKSNWFASTPEFLASFGIAEHAGVYRDMAIFEGSAKTLRSLAASGNVEIHLVTARQQQWNADTKGWLRKHRIYYRSLVHTENKETTNMDVYIDDAGFQLDKLKANGKKVIAFDQLYNKDVAEVPRVSNWSQVPAMLKKVAYSE